MLKRLINSAPFYPKSFLLLLTTALLLARPSALADRMFGSSAPVKATERSASTFSPGLSSQQSDPLNSPYPVPWNWVMKTHGLVSQTVGSGIRHYRSPSLVSPDGEYAAYSRIQLQVQPELHRSRVSSVMFLENLKTGDLQVITASSPLAHNPEKTNKDSQMPGVITMLIPVAWSSTGDRILGRQFEGLFSSSNVSDYAVIWDRQSKRTSTITPDSDPYTHAILLGWSQNYPGQVLFRTGNLGEEDWSMLAVDTTGKTFLATGDRPLIFGNLVNHAWAGPQVYR